VNQVNTPLHLNAESRREIEDALVRVGVLIQDPGGYMEARGAFDYVFLGPQPYETGDTEPSESGEDAPVLGWYPGVWAVVFGPISEAQLALLPLPHAQPFPPMVAL
jgi:hypothetical protein